MEQENGREQYTLYICGVRGSYPVCGDAVLEYGGDTACLVIRKGEHAIVLDCGTGIQNAYEALRGCEKADVIFSHLHYDHIMGLLSGGDLFSVPDLQFWGTFSLWNMNDFVEKYMSSPYWPYTPSEGKWNNVAQYTPVQLAEGVTLTLFPSCHPDDASIIRLDFPSFSFCYAVDYEHLRPFPKQAIEGCSWLIYDGMFTPKEYQDFIGWGHSDWRHGGIVGAEYGVENVFITHHAPQHFDIELARIEAAALEEFPSLRFAKVGGIFPLEE